MTEALPGTQSVRRSWLTRWDEYWFDEIPPQSMALLRIVFGAMALVGLLGLTPVDLYWSLEGLSPLPGNPAGGRSWLIDRGLADWAGRAYFACAVIAATAMTVGFRSDLAVLATFVALWGKSTGTACRCRRLTVVLSVLFCLLWTETGRVWSFDARRRRGLGGDPGGVPVWPLRLIRCQVSLIYLSSALWKLLSPAWRDGSAGTGLEPEHLPSIPWPLPIAAEPFVAFLTWGTLLFELSFPALVCFAQRDFPLSFSGLRCTWGCGLLWN